MSTRLGEYEIVRELGAGGMGTVYLAEKDGRRVAIKVVHAHLVESPGFLDRFLREVEIGRRVDHENVVRTLDGGTVDDRHFLVMEYVEGKSLRDLLDDLGTVPETLLREIALQACAGLVAVHEAGIIHRDLKPDNILITDDNEIRIMDLGVAKLQEASVALTKEGEFAGSLLYAAPEQFQRDVEVGPAADLYSLGVLLHELATGQNPFRSDDAVGIIQAHLKEEPARAHDISPFFAEVVATLLAKHPDGRFESAAVLHAVLAQAERSDWWVGREAIEDVPRIRVGRATALHGRSDSLALLRECFERAAAGRGNTVWIEGEAGIGKTRLVDEFVRGVEGAHVLYGSYPPSGGLGGFNDAVIGKFGEARLAESLAPYLTETPSLVPAFAALLRHETPPTPLTGDALQAIAVHLARALAAEKPVVWIVDDLHFAPQESLDLMLALARAVEDQPILLVATSRPGVEQSDFSRLDNFRRIQIGRLSPREVLQLLRDAFRSEMLADKLGAKIALKSDGVPFFVFEMIRGLRDGNFIEQTADGTYVQTHLVDEIEVPSAVKDLIEARLHDLTETQRAVLDAGAVQGMAFDAGLIAEVLDEKKVRVLRQIAEIERRFGLVRGEAGVCRFDQNQIQEVLYRDLLPDLRSEYHMLLAEAFDGDDPVFLAHHHLRGSRPSGALPHLEPALEKLEHSNRNEMLLDLANRALGIDGLLAGAERARILLRKAGALDLQARRDEQRAVAEETVAVADESDDLALRSRAKAALGVVLLRCSELEPGREAQREALELAKAAGDRSLEAQAINNLAVGFLSVGQYAEAEEYAERARAISHESGARRVEASAEGNIGNAYHHRGRYAEALEHFERHCALCREIGFARGEANAIGNLGIVYHRLGRHAEAMEHHENARALGRAIGYRLGEAAAIGNLGVVFNALGRHEEAREHYERYLSLSREIGYRRGEANATGNLGNVHHRLGHLAEARELFERHVALGAELGDRRGEAIATENLGVVYHKLGRSREARQFIERARAVYAAIGDRRQDASAAGVLAAVAEAEGDAAEAGRFAEESLALMREVGVSEGIAAALIPLGRIEKAPARLDEALALARETENPHIILTATLERARLPGGDVDAALAAFAEHGDHVGHDDRKEAHFRLWQLTGDAEHLAAAKRLLDYSVAHAPEEDRASMIANVPMHRQIRDARA